MGHMTVTVPLWWWFYHL